jgi:pyruvate formate lyase activating enzyme
MIKEAMFYEKLEKNRVHCYLCAHHCKIAPSGLGICGVRQNKDGTLYTLVYAEPIAYQVDPIEKKPLYHFFTGSASYSIATIGCNFKCGFCQNWQISQMSKKDSEYIASKVMPEEIVKSAKKKNCRSISYTYTEPTIFFEYAYETAGLAKTEGLYNNFVTNGYMTKEALEKIHPFLDAANVDLKSFREEFYREVCKASLKPVLDSIRLMKELGIWIEITTLLIPGQNDSEEELGNIAKFIASMGKDIPWHVSRFHPDYQFLNYAPTPVEALRKAKAIGESLGLRYVYLGNVPQGLDTYCHKCGKLLIQRVYFDIHKNNTKGGLCNFCGTTLGGRY